MNKTVFKTKTPVPQYDSVNAAGGKCFSPTAEHSLCQYAVTGCFNGTYYAGADEQLQKVTELCDKVSSVMIAKVAVYAHETGKMKDMPAYLLAVLSSRGDIGLVKQIFNRVITNVKMLCNFVQIIRSGTLGRKSFGTALKRLIQNWLINRTGDQLYFDSIGHSNPSLADIIKMVHPRPKNQEQEAAFAYILGKDEIKKAKLPAKIKAIEKFKKDPTAPVPDVPFRVLTNFDLTTEQWEGVAENMKWNTLRQNINMLQRKGVFNNKVLTTKLANKLKNEIEVKRNNVFPYQLLTTYQNVHSVPTSIKNALQDAMEHATSNVPCFGKTVAVCVDTSGSMQSPITGHRVGATTVTKCVDVAGLIAACVLRKNDDAVVVPFDTRVHSIDYNSRDSVVTNAQKFARNGGGTACSVALQHLNLSNWKGDLVIYVSDNETWADFHRQSNMNDEWRGFKRRNPKAKLVLIDLQPRQGLMVKDDKDVLNIGGWSDSCFSVIDAFVKGEGQSFVDTISSVEL